jgi:hypothetical protein
MVSSQESLPTKSAAYLYAQSVFFTQFNDVDFYVEDEHKESLYFSILSRLFPGVRIERIFPLGGKTAVIDHAQLPSRARKKVHIIDKDFDDLLGKAIELPTLIYLERYSIENFILEPIAICQYIVSEKPTLTEAKVKTSFDIASFSRQTIADLRRLFFCFFMVQKHELGFENTSLSVARFSKSKQRWVVDQSLIKSYESKVAAAAAQNGVDLAEERTRYAAAFELNRRTRFSGCNISGKYIVALLLQRISTTFRVPGTNIDSATYRIAEYCTLIELRTFQNQVKSLITNGS